MRWLVLVIKRIMVIFGRIVLEIVVSKREVEWEVRSRGSRI